MKILFPIGTFYPSQEGGPSNTVYWLAHELSNVGVEVWVITTSKGTEHHEIVKDKWLLKDFTHVIYTREINHMIPVKLVTKAIGKMREIDIVHLTSIFYPASLPLALIALIFGKKVIWSPRGELDDKALIYDKWKKKPVLFFLRWVLKDRIRFHSTSRMETNYILKHVKCKRDAIIEIPNYFRMPQARDVRIERFFLYLGRIHPKKALENLIRAVAVTTKFKEGEYTLKIAGDVRNAYAHKLIKLTRELKMDDKIQFIGFVYGVEKEQLLAQALSTLLPSHTENFGVVVIESLAHGTPVIASQGTPWGALEECNAGFWTNNDPKELAKCIDMLCDMSEPKYKVMRRNAKELAKRFDIISNIHKWTDTYKHTIKNGV